MSAMKDYVVLEDFCLNLDNGKKTVNVSRGDLVSFDGLYAESKGVRGQARNLVKVIDQWVKPYTGAPLPKKDGTSDDTHHERHATAGKIVEHSSVDRDPDAQTRSTNDDYRELQRLVDQQDHQHMETEVTSDLGDIRKEAKVVNEDSNIVAQVRDEAHTDAAPNRQGIEIGEADTERRVVVSMEEAVAKETHYNDTIKEKDAAAPPKLKVDQEGDGVEVRKVATPAINAPIRHENKTPDMSVSREEDVAKETTYDDQKSTDVSSSTQAGLESKRTVKKAAKRQTSTKVTKAKSRTGKQAPDTGKGKTQEAAPQDQVKDPEPTVDTSKSRIKVVDPQDQDGVVVAKTSKISEQNMSDHGISSSMRIGSGGEMDVGDVEIGSNDDMTVSTDVTGPGNTRADGDAAGGDIDVNDILDNM